MAKLHTPVATSEVIRQGGKEVEKFFHFFIGPLKHRAASVLPACLTGTSYRGIKIFYLFLLIELKAFLNN
jgi:hypothetical protein